MCGILGIVNVENRLPVPPSLLTAMVDTMVHRGPDDAGVWVQNDGQCGLAHRRLAIMDLSSAGHQPMATTDRRIWLTFNGEIYNYPALRKDLESRGFEFRSQSDTEAILYLYRVYGDRFIEYLDGDFAIGLWDCDEGRLILARDRAGVKPLYFTQFDGRFMFASEVKALLAYPGIDRSIDAEAFYHYLTFLVAPPPLTMIKGINKLGAASTLFLQPGVNRGFRVEKYWEPLPNVDRARKTSDMDEELSALYTASVKKRLMSDVPVGVLFSGGVDSTLNLTAFSELIAPERVKTFTVGMDNAGAFHDDSAVARTMSSTVGSNHHEIRISEDDLLVASEKLTHLQDEPVSDPVSVPMYFVTKLAREAGVTVVHAGEGADELFCGYENYRNAMKRHDRLWRPLSKAPRFLSGMGADLLASSESPRLRKIRDVLVRRSKGQKFFMSSAVAYFEQEKNLILSPGLREAMVDVDSFDVIAPFYQRLKEARPDATILQTITFIELQLRLPELLLMRADKMAMANSVELRVPFLDRYLMDFAMRVPDSFKIRDGISKEPIKRLASRHVRKETMYRPKTGFGVPIQEWFRGRLGESLLQMLSDDRGEAGELFDVPAVRGRVMTGPRTVNEAFQLWVIYNLLAWKRSLAVSSIPSGMVRSESVVLQAV